MITAKSAAKRAAEYLNDVKNVYDVSLEEIELSEDDEVWLVTLGYTSSSLIQPQKEFKIFEVDAETGEVISMKMR